MKLNKLYTAVLILVTALFAGCSEYEDSVTPGGQTPEGCQGVYFPSTNTSMFELEPSDPTTITLTIARTNTSGAAEVPVSVEANTENVFVAPSSVSFADGEAEVSFDVTFPDAAEGVTYSLQLLVSGDEYVDQYGEELPYVNTSITRIKWESVTDPFVYVDGTIATWYPNDIVGWYTQAETVELSDVIRYRFTNVYAPATEVDADGIYDGYPFLNDANPVYDYDNDYVVLIEIDKASGDVSMSVTDIGWDFGYTMVSIGSIYGNLSDNIDSYPLGTYDSANGVITFPASSLFIHDGDGNYVASTPTSIYLTKDAYLAANRAIKDYNDVQYEAVTGEVNEFFSDALSENWQQVIEKAIDIDPDNEESDYKDLYYLPNLYATGYGLAFYNYEGRGIVIPENQLTGAQFMQQDIYVSPSSEIESTVEVTSKGITVYTLGLTFHYEDGTILGDFAEKFYYSKDAIIYDKDDYIGGFNMTGSALYSNGTDADYAVNFADGADNDIIITGINYADEVHATYIPETGKIILAPQAINDIDYNGTMVDGNFITFDGDYSTTSTITMEFDLSGNIILSDESEAFAYVIYTFDLGGGFDGQMDIKFRPIASNEGSETVSVIPTLKNSVVDYRKVSNVKNNFKIKGNLYERNFSKSETDKINF
nr:hypothetical protein [uncultured Carboxylicivirga sp.]